ncbi:MAG TPA: MFS transporter, partial [Candidatus Synoicihabitans sp.]|nr:MFS transporter [Candidatus Synoicihabitans sp.]
LLMAGFFVLMGGYHAWALPRPASDTARPRPARLLAESWAVFVAFFRRRDLVIVLGFLLFYRFAEAQLLKLVPPFLLDPRADGGLGLTTQNVGVLYGTVGVVALTIGGLAGGVTIARFGLKRLLWPMVLCLCAPNLVFVYLAWAQPTNLGVIGSALAVEQFGYGFGFTAYLLYMMLIADGEHRTAHYAICTGFMALGVMLPGMAAGWVQEQLGYLNFFVWVCAATLPSFFVTALVKVDPSFGRKTA